MYLGNLVNIVFVYRVTWTCISHTFLVTSQSLMLALPLRSNGRQGSYHFRLLILNGNNVSRC